MTNSYSMPWVWLVLLCLTGTWIQAQNAVDFTLRYNATAEQYEVYGRANFDEAAFFVGGGSQVSVVVPESVDDALLSITTVTGGLWLDNSQVYAPAADPLHDFHGIASNGSMMALVSDTEVLLFTFSLPGGCLDGVRLFENASDPGSSAPGMNGGDFMNFFSNILFADFYNSNYFNLGVSCSGDLDGDGVPDQEDQCAYTAATASVDGLGCTDEDGDGFYPDASPDAPEYDPDDKRPCVPDDLAGVCDTDEDGVVDGVDTCPNTPPGAVVNNTGCSDKDADGYFPDADPGGDNFDPDDDDRCVPQADAACGTNCADAVVAQTSQYAMPACVDETSEVTYSFIIEHCEAFTANDLSITHATGRADVDLFLNAMQVTPVDVGRTRVDLNCIECVGGPVALGPGTINLSIVYKRAAADAVLAITQEQDDEIELVMNDVHLNRAGCSGEAALDYSFSIFDCAGFEPEQLQLSFPDGLMVSSVSDLIAGTSFDAMNPASGSGAVRLLSSGELPAGQYYLTAQYKGVRGAATLQISQSAFDFDSPLACNDKVNITLDPNTCSTPLLPDLVLEGFPEDPACAEGFYVKVAYPYDGFSINSIRKTGEFKYVAYRIEGLPDWVEGYNTPQNDHATQPDEMICWGYVNAEDKTPPSGCIRKVVALHRTAVGYQNEGDFFAGSRTAELVDDKYWKYDPVTCDEDQEGCQDQILAASLLADPNTYLLTQHEVDSIFNIRESWEDEKYAYFTGVPQLTDACAGGPLKILSVRDKLHDFECEYQYDPCTGHLMVAVVQRTFVFQDDNGNTGEVNQEICFYRPLVYLPACKVEVDKCTFDDIDRENTETELDPDSIGSGFYYRIATGRKVRHREHDADLAMTYEDLIFPGPAGCGFKVVRTWTILDCCWNDEIYQAQGPGNPLALVGTEFPDCPAPAYEDWRNKKWVFEQYIIVGDQRAPVVECHGDNNHEENAIIASTGPFDCTSNFEVPPPIVTNDECGYTWTVEVYSNVPMLWHGVPTGEYELKKLTDVHIITDDDTRTGRTRSVKALGIPLGQHYLQYLVRDHCGNEGSSEKCLLYVKDTTTPVAICDDNLHIAVTSGSGSGNYGGGFARVFATDIDEGSRDNCGEIRLRVRRFVPEDCLPAFEAGSDLGVGTDKITIDMPGTVTHGKDGYWTEWADYVDFVCCDISPDPATSKVMVEMGVWDLDAGEANNFNKCWLEVTLEDKLGPECMAPKDLYLTCEEVPGSIYLPEDGTTWEEFTPRQQDALEEWFAAISPGGSASDNCLAGSEMIDVKFNIHCKAGWIERRFQSADASGSTSGVCKQRIYLSRHHDYCIKFPQDAQAECEEDPLIPGVELFEYACDLLAVSIQDERFDVPQGGDDCYHLFRTYRVLNWCQFEEDIDPATALFDRFETVFNIAPLVVSRDEDDDGKPGDEDVYVRFTGWEYDDTRRTEIEDFYGQHGLTGFVLGESKTEGYTFIDDDCDPSDQKGDDPATGYWRAVHFNQGFYQYTQVIKIKDNASPIISYTGEDRFPSSVTPEATQSRPAYQNNLPVVCTGRVEIEVEADEGCGTDQLNVYSVHWLPDPALGLSSSVLFDRGAPMTAATSYNFQVSRQAGGFSFSGDFPIGFHELDVQVKDGCGNAAAAILSFEVFDDKAPAPICISTISTTLSPDGEGGGSASIWAKDFIASEIQDCSGPVKYTVHLANEVDALEVQGKELVPNFATDASLVVTCEYSEVVLLYIYAWDGAGNGDRCEALLLITEQESLCNPPDGPSIAGVIATEQGEGVAGVQVQLSGRDLEERVTRGAGTYQFNNGIRGNDYTIKPTRNDGYRNGVSTLDLITISKHILGVKLLDSPYKLIAADADNSRAISTLDLIHLRKLILSIDVELRKNASWRFVDAEYRFTDPVNPWLDQFPEVINFNDLEMDQMSADFIAVKVGDVTGDAQTSESAVRPRHIQGLFQLAAADRELKAGNEYEVEIRGVDLDEIQGFQMTLQVKGGVRLKELKYGLAGAGNFGLTHQDQGFMTVSWDKPDEVSENDPIFTLVMSATSDRKLSEALSIGSRYTQAEAYDLDGDLLDIDLLYTNPEEEIVEFELLQNTPNPFKERTTVAFYLPEEGEARLMIHDASGRLIHQLSDVYNRGYNEVEIVNTGYAPGILYYSLHTDRTVKMKSMVVIE